MAKAKVRPQKVPLGKQVKELRTQMEMLRKQFQMFNLKLAEHHKIFDERSMTSWEYLWATVETLREEGHLEFLTEDRIEHFRKIVMQRWRAEAFEELKKNLLVGQGICERCHHVAGGPEFFKGAEEESTCPNCKSKGTAYLKDTTVNSADDAQEEAS